MNLTVLTGFPKVGDEHEQKKDGEQNLPQKPGVLKENVTESIKKLRAKIIARKKVSK